MLGNITRPWTGRGGHRGLVNRVMDILAGGGGGGGVKSTATVHILLLSLTILARPQD